MKICGITRPLDAVFAEKAGADAIGVILFSESKRLISPERAKDIFASAGPFLTRVCVSHTKDPGELKRILSVHPDAVQLSHPLRVPESAGVRVIRSVRQGDTIPEDADALIIDASHGCGVAYDEEFVRQVRSRAEVPVILAGGLTPDTVSFAVRTIQPYAVDVASGVESAPGIKDHALVEAFIRNAREVC